MAPITLLLLCLALGLVVVAVVGRRKGNRRPKKRYLAEEMRQFGRRHPDFVAKLVREHEIQNVILYRFIDGYREEGDYSAPASRAEEIAQMDAARLAIKELLTEPPLGIAAPAETLEDALDAWRRVDNE